MLNRRLINSGWFDCFNDFGNLVLGLCGTLGSVSTAATVPGILFNFSTLAGLVDIMYVCQWYKRNLANPYSIGEGKDNRNIKPQDHSELLMFTKFGAGVFLIFENIESFHSVALGAPGCGLLPIALAIRSGVDLLCAMEAFYHENNRRDGKSGAASVDIIKKAVAFTGWCMIATGNPLGWAFLVASAGLSFVARAKFLGGHGLFSFADAHSLENESDQQNQDGIGVYNHFV